VGDTFAVIGFSSYAAGVTAHFRAVLSLATASGPYSLVVHNSSAIATGTAAAISCAAVPAATVAGAGRSARGDVLSAMPK
jgi:hypothetical protein